MLPPLTPSIELVADYFEFFRELGKCLLPKLCAAPLKLFSFHFAAPFLQSVQYSCVSLEGVTPRIRIKQSTQARLPGLIVVCFGRFWVRDRPFPNARRLGHAI